MVPDTGNIWPSSLRSFQSAGSQWVSEKLQCIRRLLDVVRGCPRDEGRGDGAQPHCRRGLRGGPDHRASEGRRGLGGQGSLGEGGEEAWVTHGQLDHGTASQPASQ